MENKTQDVPKKCFCARCFLPIDEKEKIEIDGQNFHSMCGTCCICRHIPTKLKMFYGHVFCEECFKKFVLARLRGETPQVHVDSWWMQFAPGVKAQGAASEGAQQPSPKPEAKPAAKPTEQPTEGKRCMCARCLQAVDDADKVEIGGQTFHCCCARCCSCHQVPKENIKIYCGQVFCEACFNQHILSRNRDNPTEFFRTCFEQWQNNPQFAENVRMFMESSASAHSPLIFMAPPSCRVNAEREEVDSKSATPASTLASWDLTNDNRTEVSYPGSGSQASAKTSNMAAAEKIEKLTKYFRDTSNFNTETPKKWYLRDTSKFNRENPKKWKRDSFNRMSNWDHLPGPVVSSQSSCPKCLWQSGTIYVNRD